MEGMTGHSFGQCIADVLNLFFRAGLNGWDVDFCIGRQSVRVVPLGQKIWAAECWHNPDRNFTYMVNKLSAGILHEREWTQSTYWARMGVRIAVLFAAYAQLRKQNILRRGQCIDISVPTEDFSLPMACWYARRMGLPVGNIVCACRDSSRLWDFYRNGSLSLTQEENRKGVLRGLEPLIYSCLGREEVLRFLQKIASGCAYTLQEIKRKEISDGFRVCVISSSRMDTVIRSTCSSSAYPLDKRCALAFAGIQDNRTAEGESRVTLLLSQTPMQSTNS